jgi:putative transposase-like DNA-binding protein
MSSSRHTAAQVLRLRVKDKHAAWLGGLAREVNTVFNYCNELSVKVFERERRFLSGFDFWPFLKGVTRGDCALHLPVQAVQEIAEEYARRRRQHRKIRLAWRKSGGARRSLGWIPFKVRTLRYRGGQVYFAGRWLSLWDSYGLGNFELRAGNFSEDSRGRWYLNVKANGAIFVGNVNASALAKTRQAKSVLDAGWSAFRTMLQYKCAHAGVWFAQVDEAFSTQTCSVCNSRAGPKGRKDLGIRGWQCPVCGAIHDRNVNAAHNILAAGHRRLAEGILVPRGRGGCQAHL